MTMILLAVGCFLLVAPRVLSSLGRQLHPREQVTLSVRGVVLGAVLVELALVLFAYRRSCGSPGSSRSRRSFVDRSAILRPTGYRRLAHGRTRGSRTGTGVARSARSITEVSAMRVEPVLGVHREIDGVDVVTLPTDVPIAYGIDDGRPQIVVSRGLAARVAMGARTRSCSTRWRIFTTATAVPCRSSEQSRPRSHLCAGSVTPYGSRSNARPTSGRQPRTVPNARPSSAHSFGSWRPTTPRWPSLDSPVVPAYVERVTSAPESAARPDTPPTRLTRLHVGSFTTVGLVAAGGVRRRRRASCCRYRRSLLA